MVKERTYMLVADVLHDVELTEEEYDMYIGLSKADKERYIMESNDITFKALNAYEVTDECGLIMRDGIDYKSELRDKVDYYQLNKYLDREIKNTKSKIVLQNLIDYDLKENYKVNTKLDKNTVALNERLLVLEEIKRFINNGIVEIE